LSSYIKALLLAAEVMLLHAEVMPLQKVVLDHKKMVCRMQKERIEKKHNKC